MSGSNPSPHGRLGAGHEGGRQAGTQRRRYAKARVKTRAGWYEMRTIPYQCAGGKVSTGSTVAVTCSPRARAAAIAAASRRR